MSITIINDNQNSLKNKIDYVIKTFLDYVGSNNSQKNLKILYSQLENVNNTDYDIILKTDPKAIDFFSNKYIYNINNIKFFNFENESIPILFHNNFTEPFIFDQNRKQLTIFIDIFASAFYFLSLWDEYVIKERDNHNRFIGKNSLLNKLDFLRKPIVTIYFNYLIFLINNYFNINIQKRNSYASLTHDIDYIKKWSPGIIYRECIQYFLLNRLNVNFRKRFSRFYEFLKAFLIKNDPYLNSLNKIIEFELKNNIRSTFFIKTGCTSKHDVSYSVKNKFVKRKVEFLKEQNFDVGLHPSYKTYNNEIIMKDEKNRLINLLNNDKFGVRQHYLRYDINITPIIHEKLYFIYDSSLGYHDVEGFRTGFSFPHYLYSNKNDKVLNIIEIPLVIMDSTLEYYRKLKPQQALNVIKEITNIIQKYGGVLTILFHNTCYDELDYPGWGSVYEDMVHNFINNNIQILTLQKILTAYFNS